MVYFLYGTDTFRSRRKLNEIIAKFKEKQGSDVNFQRFCAPHFSAGQFLDAVQSVGFFSSKRLVVVEKLLSEGSRELQQDVAESLAQIPEEVLVVFWEEGTPEKSPLYPLLCQPKVSQEFATLDQSELEKWILEEANRLGCLIEPEAVCRLAEISLGDLWLVSTELEKLACLRAGLKITAADISKTFAHKKQIKIFELTDALVQKKVKIALESLHRLLDQGESEQRIISMLSYQLRNMAIIKDLLERKYTPRQIAQISKLHSFQIKKITAGLQLFTLDEIRNLYEKLLELDYLIKTGRVEATLGLEKFLIESCDSKNLK